MARTPRKLVFDADKVGVYHCVQRCVRRAFLCGKDATSGRSYEHRREWLQRRLEFLAGVFGIDVLAFAVMSNHLHVVLRNRPDVVRDWSDEDIARRWWRLSPQRFDDNGSPVEPAKHDLSRAMLDEKRLAELRARLSSLPWFMRYLAEGIARQANAEDECTGRFWEGRYKCQPLLDEAAVTACMAYVDLNPIRAGLAKTPETSRFTSAYERLQAKVDVAATVISTTATPARRKTREKRLTRKERRALKAQGAQAALAARPRDHWLSPIEVARTHVEEQSLQRAMPNVGRASARGCLPMSEADYLKLLDWTGRHLRRDKRGAIPTDLAPILERLGVTSDSWFKLVSSFRRLFRQAAGRPASLATEANRRGQHWLQGMRASHEVFSAAPSTPT